MSDSDRQPTIRTDHEAKTIEPLRRRAELSTSIMDMSEEELNEAIASIDRRLTTASWQDRSVVGSTPSTSRDLAPPRFNRYTRFEDTAETWRPLNAAEATAGTGSGRVEQWGAKASSLLADLTAGRAEPPVWSTQRTGDDDVTRNVTVQNDRGLRRTLPTIKLEPYNGSTPLETHLAKLNNCAEYYNWTARDRLCHLKASLEGHAGQVLWELGSGSTEEEIVKLLRNRFGNVNQMERYRAELRSRRRKRGESIQAVYQDVRRLLALGFPGHSGELCEIIGRDAFLEALADPALRVRVLDQQPTTLDEALAIVCRMEAYSGITATADEVNEDGGRKRIRAVGASPPTKITETRKLTDLFSNWSRVWQHSSVKFGNYEPTPVIGRIPSPPLGPPNRPFHIRITGRRP